jgi:integral membrane protein (TIGR01906 family)
MSSLYTRFLQSLIIVLLPVLLVIGSVRLLNTDEYLTFEYGKASFPADPFGFERTQRLDYASVNFRYVRENQPIDALAGLRLGDQPIYNARELKHMQDVQETYQMTMRIWHFALGITLLAGLALAWELETSPALFAALRLGGLLTAGLIAVTGVLALIAWRFWFVGFHQVFFTAGTWTFNFSDTLIRLFPEKFWFDAALTISGLSLAGGLSLALIGWWLRPYQSSVPAHR